MKIFHPEGCYSFSFAERKQQKEWEKALEGALGKRMEWLREKGREKGGGGEVEREEGRRRRGVHKYEKGGVYKV